MTNPVNTETPDPIAMFTEAEDDFDEARVQLISLLQNKAYQRASAGDLKREMAELEADIMLGIRYSDYGIEGKNAEERKAALVQAMASDPRVEALRKKAASGQAQEEIQDIDIEHQHLCLSSARARRQFATTLLAYLATAQDDRIAMTPEGTAAVGAES